MRKRDGEPSEKKEFQSNKPSVGVHLILNEPHTNIDYIDCYLLEFVFPFFSEGR